LTLYPFSSTTKKDLSLSRMHGFSRNTYVFFSILASNLGTLLPRNRKKYRVFTKTSLTTKNQNIAFYLLKGKMVGVIY